MTDSQITLEAVNRMAEADFVAAFGAVVEGAAWVAAEAAADRPFATREAMVDAFARAVADAAPDRQEALLTAQPGLAGKVAMAGTRGTGSGAQTVGEGLEQLTPVEFTCFTEMNETYRKQNGFPFMLAVRGMRKQEVLAALEARVGEQREAEFGRGIEQVQRMIQYRIEERVQA